MAKTAQLDLPLVLPAQAQKHVTVNEALARLDAVAQLRVISSRVATPPADGGRRRELSGAGGATGRLAGMAGQIAVRSNGGWVVSRAEGRLAGLGREPAAHQMFDGTGWVPDAVVVSPHGAATAWQVLEFDHAWRRGTNATAVAIPSHAQVDRRDRPGGERR